MQTRIQGYLRAVAPIGRDREKIGPFLATYSRNSKNPFLNYAVPDDLAIPTESDVASLIDAYERRGLRARLEYMPEASPEVEASLLRAGFVQEGRLPLMATDPSHVRDVRRVEGIEVISPETDDDLYGMALVQHEAYEEPEPPSREIAGSMRRAARNGSLHLVAVDMDTRRVVGAGSCTPITDGLTEVGAIGVSKTHRNRGIATLLSRELAGEAIGRGADIPWLMAAHDTGQRAYERAGFKVIGEVLHISIPEP